MWGGGITRSPQKQRIISRLSPSQHDHVINKWRYSAFQRSELEPLIKEMDRDQIIICGIYAHIGCLNTACDAFMRDIKPFFVGDAVADFSLDKHLMALEYVAGLCGKVVSTQDVINSNPC